MQMRSANGRAAVKKKSHTGPEGYPDDRECKWKKCVGGRWDNADDNHK